MISLRPNKFYSKRIDKNSFFYLLLMVIVCVLYFFYTFKKCDIIPSDDYVYINAGYYLLLPLKINYLGFFYPLYFKCILLINSHNGVLTGVYIAYFILSIGSFLGFYIYLKKLKIRNEISFFLSYTLLFSNYQIYLFPKISLLCIIFILFTLQAVQDKPLFVQLFWLTILLWVLSYTRPEFFASFITSYLSLLCAFIYKKKYVRAYNFLGLLVPIILFVSGTLLFAGQPITNRGVDAFKQHFVLNYLEWNPSVVLGDKEGDEFVLFKKVYGNVDTVRDIFSTNFPLFCHHILTNITNYVQLSYRTIYEILIWPLLYVFGVNTRYVFLGVAVITIFFIDFKATFCKVKNDLNYFGVKNGYILFLVLFPTIISVIFIYPRNHYFLFHLIIYLSVVGISLNAIVFKTNTTSKILHVSVLVLLLVSAKYSLNTPSKAIKFLEMYEHLIKFTKKHEVDMASNELMSPIFFKEELHKYIQVFFTTSVDNNIECFLSENPINVIYLNRKLIDGKNQELVRFINSKYKDYDFKKDTTYQDLNYLIFIKNGIK